MQKPSDALRRTARALTAGLLLAAGAVTGAYAQAKPAPAAVPTAAPATPAAAPAPAGGVQSQNIFEVKPDASSDPNYAKQTNAERAQGQPGNNAPVWRAVGAGAEGYTSLPKSEAPEAGVLIQPFVQYPGSRFSSAGESWRQVRNNIIIPYGAALLLIAVGAMALFYFSKRTPDEYLGNSICCSC